MKQTWSEVSHLILRNFHWFYALFRPDLRNTEQSSRYGGPRPVARYAPAQDTSSSPSYQQFGRQLQDSTEDQFEEQNEEEGMF